jgi:two-component system sensor histidine kinase EvgS
VLSSQAPPTRPGRRVLVVDDHPVPRLVALAQLAELGYAADAAENGETALAALAREPYDAVLLDCEMPGLDGYETCRRLRQREGDGRRTRVIALTAHTSPEERERCLAAGMDDHLGKPWRAEDLAAAIEPDCIEEQLAALARLGEATGEEILDRVIASFLRQGARDLETMRRALAHGDGAALAAAAHSLAGSSGILRATQLAGLCAELEAGARRQDLAACELLLGAVEQAYPPIATRLSKASRGSTHNKC